MKLVFSISFLLVVEFFAQPIPIDKRLPVAGVGGSVILIGDNNYVIGTSSNNNLSFIQYDLQNNQFTYRSYDAVNNSLPYILNPLNRTSEGGYMLIGSKMENLGGKSAVRVTYLIRLDENGDSLWSKSFGGELDQYGLGCFEYTDGSIYSVSANRYSSTFISAIIIKTDQEGNLIWKKNYDRESPVHIGYKIQKLNDNNILLFGGSIISKIDTAGNVIWELTSLNHIHSVFELSGGSIIVGCENNIKKFNNDGDLILNEDFNGTVLEIVKAEENKYAAVVFDTLYHFDLLTESLDVEWSHELIGYPGKLINNNTGFTICGSNNNVWLKTTNEDGISEGRFLQYPAGGNTIHLFNDYEISWTSSDDTYINLEYTTDSGVNWYDIISYYPSSLKSFNWQVPNEFSNQCYVKISEYNNPENFDQNILPFSINLEYGNDVFDYVDANRALMWFSNNGYGSHDPNTDGSGFYWPVDETEYSTGIFQDGFLYGGVFEGEIRVGGTTHKGALSAGRMFEGGIPDDPFQEKYKIYKIIKDWELLPLGSERDRYEYDYFNWPVEDGAPWIDVDGDDIFTEGIDKPKIIGDQTLFYVANAGDTLRSLFLYGSLPLPLEIQTTIWAYENELLEDVVFKKYKIINRGYQSIDSLIFTCWTDDDLGDANDDFSGCDTLLDLGYTYNADENDEHGGYGSPPPAVGHILLQGPIVEGEPSDSAFYNDEWITGYENLPITHFSIYINSPGRYRDPASGIYEGTLEMYNYMNGLVWDGEPFIDPNTGDTVKIILAGDPIGGTGWYEGEGWPGGPDPIDRRFVMSSGPVNLDPGEEQEVVYAIFMAKGSDRLNSITELKQKAAEIRAFYKGDIILEQSESNLFIPRKFYLSQNYPNPFNPTTIIEFNIPFPELGQAKFPHTSLIVYDILGKEVKTLLNKPMQPGRHKIEFNAGNLATGVYFYRVKAGEFTDVKKMILIK